MYDIEVTDTFGGEPSYCWVIRGTTRAKSRQGLIRAIKKLAKWDGWVRVRVHHWDGEFIEVRPCDNTGVCQVAFAIWRDD